MFPATSYFCILDPLVVGDLAGIRHRTFGALGRRL
jgi:hypothetical protein